MDLDALILFLNNNEILIAIAMPWTFGDIVGIFTLGVLAGTGLFTFSTALIVPIISEIVIETTAAIFLKMFNEKPFALKIKDKINNFRGYRSIERIENMSFIKRLLTILMFRPMPGTRFLILTMVITTNITIKDFFMLFVASSIIWNTVLFFIGYFGGVEIKVIYSATNSILLVFTAIIAYIVCFFTIFYITGRISKARMKKRQEESSADDE